MTLTIQQWKDTQLLPTSGMLAWNTHESGVSADGVCEDYSGNAKHLTQASNKPVLQSNVLYGNPAWYFDGTKNPLVYSGSWGVPKHFFILASAEESAFTDYRGLLSGLTNGDVLTSNTSGTKWFDFAYGANWEYLKNNTAFADNAAEAPMSGNFALMEVQIPSGLLTDGIQIGKQRNISPDRLWKGWFVEHLAYSRVLTLAERKRVMLYFNLRYSAWKLGLPFYFPSDDFMNFRRRRFYAEPPEHEKITESYEYEDGGKTFNEVGDVSPRRWEYEYMLTNNTASTDPPEIKIFDEFNDQARKVNPFNFTDKYGTVWENVRIDKYERSHESHKPWRQNVKFDLVKYP